MPLIEEQLSCVGEDGPFLHSSGKDTHEQATLTVRKVEMSQPDHPLPTVSIHSSTIPVVQELATNRLLIHVLSQ